MPAVQNSFAVEFKKGFWAWFSQAERSEIICTVYRLNRACYDVTLMVCFGNKGLSDWPCVDYNGGKVDVLRDPRVAETLRKLGMGDLWLPWSFGKKGDNKLRSPWGIATNSQGQFIVADEYDGIVKVFDSSGKFLHSFGPFEFPDGITRFYKFDVATDHNDNIYIVVQVRSVSGDPDIFHVYIFSKTAGLLDTFRLWERKGLFSLRLTAITLSENNKVLLLGKLRGGKSVVVVHETDGQFFGRFAEGILKNINACDITAADGRVMIMECSDTGNFVHIFSEEGRYLKKFKLEDGSCQVTNRIAFHQASGHVIVSSEWKVLIYTKDGQFVRSVEHNGKDIRGITVSEAGRIAVTSWRSQKVFFLQ